MRPPIEKFVSRQQVPADVEQIERTVPAGAAAGTRYNAYLMGQLDSEK